MLIKIFLFLQKCLKNEVIIITRMGGYNMSEFNISRNLYGFSLSDLTSRILWRLKPLDMCYEIWPNNIDHYLQMLIHDQPKYILGIGTYSGIDQDDIRIETITKNQFCNEAIEKDLQKEKTILLQPFVRPVDQTKYASAIGNSWCNLVSWKIARLIEKGELQSRYNFLHIPKSFKTNTALEIIEAMVQDIKAV